MKGLMRIGKVLDFYNSKEKSLNLQDQMILEIEEDEEESIFINEEKLQEALAEIKSRNPSADIIIFIDEPDVINQKAIENLMLSAKLIDDESDMLEFEGEE